MEEKGFSPLYYTDCVILNRLLDVFGPHLFYGVNVKLKAFISDK